VSDVSEETRAEKGGRDIVNMAGVAVVDAQDE